MDQVLEQQFSDLQRALNELRAGVSAKLDEQSKTTQERTARRKEAIVNHQPIERTFRISSITVPSSLSPGPWTISWVETDGVTDRRHQRTFSNRLDAEQLLESLDERWDQENLGA